MSAELLVDGGIGELRSALVADGEVLEIRLHRTGEPAPEAVYLARVTALARDAGGAFLSLGKAGDAFLPLRKGRPALSEGAILAVQVRAPAGEPGKAVTVDSEIRLRGRYLALTRNGRGFDPAGATLAGARLAKLEEVLGSILEAARLTLRPAAGVAPDEAIIAEGSRLFGQLRALAAAGGTPRLALAPPDPLARILRDAPADLDRIRLGGRHLMPAVQALIRQWPDLADRIAVWREPTPLFEAHGVEARLDELITGVLPLPSGGRLWIEDTHAGTVIDVDAGATAPGRAASLARRRANEEAAVAIARLLRLADIGGLVLVDFIDPEGAAARAALLRTLDRALAADPVPVHRAGLSGHGVLSLTRRRTGASVRALLLAPARPALSTESAGFALLRMAEATAERDPRPGTLVLTAPANVLDWLAARGFEAALAARTGRPVRLDPAPAGSDIGTMVRIDPL